MIIRCFWGQSIRLSTIFSGIFEALLIGRGNGVIGVTWYLRAMIPIMPIFIMWILLFPKKLIVITGGGTVVLYYGVIRLYWHWFPYMYPRVFAGMTLGVVSFYFAEFLKKHLSSNITTKTVSIIILIMPVFLCSFEKMDRAIVVLLIVGFSSIFAGLSFQVNDNRITDICRRYSLNIYLVHLQVLDRVCWYSKNVCKLSKMKQYALAFIFTVLFAVLLEIAVRILKQVVNAFGVVRIKQ